MEFCEEEEELLLLLFDEVEVGAEVAEVVASGEEEVEVEEGCGGRKMSRTERRSRRVRSFSTSSFTMKASWRWW